MTSNVTHDDRDALMRRIAELEAQLKETRTPNRTEPTSQTIDRSGAAESQVEIAPIQDGEATLRRLVQRIAMILQAEKIVIMFYDQERGELMGIPPSFGLEQDRLELFRVRATQGISGEVFRTGEPIIFHSAAEDPRTRKEMVSLLHVDNGITVPLVIEKRDEENRVIERNTIGVLHAFNKRHGEDFNDEDVRLLERMAKNVGSIIANLQLYREVVEKREELLQTFESLISGLVLISPNRKISQMNSAARAVFDLEGDVVGKELDIIPSPEVVEFLQKGLDGDETPAIEVTTVLAGLERHFSVQGAQVSNEEGKSLGFVTILNDITEQKNLDRMKSSFVAMASHELRTPLTAIKGFTSTLLMDDSFTREEQNEFLGIIESECDRLRRLIDDLLNTARIEANQSLKPDYGTVELPELLRKVVLVQTQASHKHRVFAKLDDNLPATIIGDSDKLDQALTNLMNNAIKYSPEGGDVVLHAFRDGDEVEIWVEDQGIGIPETHLGKVFDRFHRVDNQDNRKIYGTGLGLFLVKHLVESVHLGKVWAESEVGKGSTFKMRVPIELDLEKAEALND
ncbi:MAG: GAF domain-containing protein [Fimbriimonadaceae bacterium]|nr:GAF domain-containing protein [Fimbriimonadaceae bacterium]